MKNIGIQSARGNISTRKIILLKKILDKNTNPQSNSNSSHKFESIITKKLTTHQKKAEEKIKHNWPKGIWVVIGDSMVAIIDECNKFHCVMSSPADLILQSALYR